MSGLFVALWIFAGLLGLITLILVWGLMLALTKNAEKRADYWDAEARRTRSFMLD